MRARLAFLCCATLLAATMSTARAAPCAFDLTSVPETKGVVSQTLADLDGRLRGVVLQNGTEIAFPESLPKTALDTAQVGHTIVARGLSAPSLALVSAVSIDGQCGASNIAPPVNMGAAVRLVAQGTVARTLYDISGAPIGALLRDRSVIWLPRTEGPRYAAWLAAGRPLFAAGAGVHTLGGQVIDASELGPDGAHVVDIDQSALPPGPAPGSPDYDEIGNNDTSRR